MSKGVQIAIGTLSVFAALAWFISAGTAGEGTFRYYASVADYVAAGDGDSGASLRGLRVHGFVQDGSILKNLPEGYVEFTLGDGSESILAVRYEGIDVPDLFKDGAEVVVEGHQRDGVFVADRLMAKCPSKYEAREEPGAEV